MYLWLLEFSTMATITFSYRSKKSEAALEARLSFRVKGDNLNPKNGAEMPYSYYTRSRIKISKPFWDDYRKGKKFKDIDKQIEDAKKGEG